MEGGENGKRICGVASPERNRISDLPDSLLDHILDCLKIDDVVRTSALSKTWRNRWKHMHKLDFDALFFTKYGQLRKQLFDTIVSSVLLRQNGPVSTFRLCVPNSVSRSEFMDVGGWLGFLAGKGIRDLTVCGFKGYDILIPSEIFSCSTRACLSLRYCRFGPSRDLACFGNLTRLYLKDVIVPDQLLEIIISKSLLLEELELHCQTIGVVHMIRVPFNISNFPRLIYLSLTKCQLEPSNDFGGFNKLKRLELEDVLLPDLLLKNMISKSPLLEHLGLSFGEEGNPVMVDALNLRSLYFVSPKSSRPLCLRNCPNLTHALLKTKLVVSASCLKTFQMNNLVYLLPKIENLTLNGLALMSLAAGDISERLPTAFQNLKELHLFIAIVSPDQIASALCLVRNSPYLQSLEIYMEEGPSVNMNMEAALQLCDAQVMAGFLSNVSTVRFHYLMGWLSEELFIGTFLSCCPMLETVRIGCNTNAIPEAKKQLIYNLLGNQRFSSSTLELQV